MKRLMMVGVLVMALFALAACATGNEESGTATASALQSTADAASTSAAATAAVVQATVDAASAASTQVITDAQATADAASTEMAGQPTDEPTEVAPTVVPATEEPTAEATAEEATVEATVEEPTEEAAEPTEESQAVTEEPTVEATVEEEATVEATAEEAATEEATAEATEEEAAATEEATEEAVVEATDAPDAEGVTTVCLVTDLGRINDGSFNQSAYEGMLRAEADFGLTTKYIETQAQTDYEANINTCLDEGFDVVVTVGFLIYDATIAAAKANPDVYFIGVDQFPAEAVANFAGIQFREDQAGFLAGAMAALMTETDKVGGVYGIEIPPVVKFRNGFEQGAKFINPEIELFGVYIPDFIAPQLGAETAQAFVNEQGVDVVFGAGGPTGSGGIVRAAELGAWVIGVDKDEYLSTFGNGETPGADKIITSAVKRVDNGVYDMIAAVLEGGAGFPEGSLYLMDAAINGVGFAPAHDAAVPDEVTEQVQGIFEQLASGELETGVDPVTGALLDAPVEEVATEEAAVEEATVEATAEEAVATEEAAAAPTEEAATEEATVEATAEEAATEEATAEATEEEAAATEEATEEAVVEATDAPDAEGVTTVCLVTDLGRINDGSFNQSAYEGMLRAEADFGLTTKYIETQAQTDYEANINTCLDEGFDVVVTVGFLIYDATIAAAKANPDVYFIGVDQFPAEAVANFAGIQFREDQAGFLAGAMAALMTETDKVGGVYGIEIPPVVKFRNGFEQGAKFINPEIELFGVYIPDFIAPQLGAETAQAFVNEQGVDVVFGAGGPTGSGGIVRAAELGAWVIGVDKDEYLSTFGNGETPGADKIITSAVKRVDNGVYDMIAAVLEGGAGFPEGSLYLMDAAINGVGFAPAHDAAVPDEVTEQVQGIFEQLASGELETGVDPVTGALLDAPVEEVATEEATEEAPVEATATPGS